MNDITKFGRALHDMHVKIQVPSVDILGIEAGEYEIQRLVYHFFLKCFWNSSFTFEDNAAINYDWYHPQLSSRHTLEEVESWFSDADLEIVNKNVDNYGITVRGIRN
jgi:hypothetical protein